MIRNNRHIKFLIGIKPKNKILFIITFLLLLSNGMALLSPWIAGVFTQHLLGEPVSQSFSFQNILLLWFVILICQAMLNYWSGYLSAKTSEEILARLRRKLYSHLQSLPVSYYYQHKKGDVLALHANETVILSNFVSHTLVSVLPLLLTALGAFLCISYIHPLIGFLVVFLIPLFYISTKFLGRPVGKVSKDMMNYYRKLFSLIEENLTNLSIIKSFTREKIEERRYQEHNLKLLSATTEYYRLQSMISPVTKLMATTIILIILWIVSDEIIQGLLLPSDIIRLLLFGMLLTQPISGLANMYGQARRARMAADQLLKVFSQPGEDVVKGKKLHQMNGDISFRGISYQYPTRPNLFTDLTLNISAGETLAITGPNGAGKSSLMHLLVRLMSPTEGNIYIDNININEYSLESLRSNIGLVQQQVHLQNATIYDNISYGMVDATEEAIHQAAKKSLSLEFIQNLPNGFQTVIGDQGIKLSGGQKQRLALARALIKDPPILILDEATAMFDPEGEKSFIKECEDLFESKTVILITHRPEILVLANRVVTIRKGKICPHSSTG